MTQTSLESNDTPVPQDFGWALQVLRDGGRVSRTAWTGLGQFLKLEVLDAGGGITLPFIFLAIAQRDVVPWIPSQTDLLAGDWLDVK